MAELTGRPLYVQIADDLRRLIIDGRLPPGEQLPSIGHLMAEYQTSSTTVRQALSLLRGEGHILGRQGKGSFVRPSRPRRRRLMDLYSARPEASPVDRSVEQAGEHARWEHHSEAGAATAAIAERLAIDTGDPVMTTQYRFFAGDDPLVLSTSHEPLAITGGTPIELPESGPVTGVIPRFDLIGIHITRVVENVTARSARPHEIEALRVPQGIPVMSIERTYHAGDRVVETADIVVSADTYTLSYTLPIPD